MAQKSVSPQACHIANLWSLAGHPAGEPEWSLERKVGAVKEAGFDGFMGRLTPEHGRLAEKFDLQILGFFNSADESEFAELFQQQKDAGATVVNIQLGAHDTPVADAIHLAQRVIESGREIGLRPSIEVHRGTCTETPEKAYAIADGFQQSTGERMPITWDFSHFAVVKHLIAPFQERLLVRPDLVQNSEFFHFRPFNGHHCQVPVTDVNGNLTGETEEWLPFVEDTLQMWLASEGNANRAIYLVPEMGPVGGYNLSTLPPSWPDSIRLREELDKTWNKALQRAGRES